MCTQALNVCSDLPINTEMAGQHTLLQFSVYSYFVLFLISGLINKQTTNKQQTNKADFSQFFIAQNTSCITPTHIRLASACLAYLGHVRGTAGNISEPVVRMN